VQLNDESRFVPNISASEVHADPAPVPESGAEAELARLRTLVGPDQQSYEELRYDLIRLRGEYRELEREAGRLRGENAHLHSENGSLSFRSDLAFRQRDLALQSKPYRIGRLLTAPLRGLRRLLRTR
jgi:hypothetical protein